MLLLAATLARADALVDVVDVGLGVRRVSALFDAAPWSGRAFARVGLGGRYAVELGGAVRFPGDAVTSTGETLMLVHYEANAETTFTFPVPREVGALSLVGQISPWVRKERKGLSAWPYLAVGGELRVVRADTGTMSERYAAGEDVSPVALSPGRGLTGIVGPAAGLGFDLLHADRVGARILWLERLSIEPEPDFGDKLPDGTPAPLDTVLTLSSAVAVDLLVRFR